MQIDWNDADLLLRLINAMLKDEGNPRAQQARDLGKRLLAAFPGVFAEMFPDLV